MDLRLGAIRAVFCFCSLPLLAQTNPADVLTRGFDNNRTGAQTHETRLTRDFVKANGISRVTTIPVTGDARGMEASPLVLSGVDGQNVMLLPSMANVVRGVVAESGRSIWQTTLCQPVNGGSAVDFHQINDHWGVLSTPVIDPETRKAYLVALCSEDGSGRWATARHHVFVLGMADGAVQANVLVEGTSGTQVYSAAMRKQRSSLLLTNVAGVKTVFCASGTVLEVANGAAGFVFAFDTYTNRISATLAMSQGLGAGIWMAGQGLAADKAGYLYAITGNGSYNAVNDFGEAVVKMQYVPPTATSAASLQVIDSWAPFSDAGRIGQNPTLSGPIVPRAAKLAGVSAPSDPVGANMAMPTSTKTVVSSNGTPLVFPLNTGRNAAWSDEDFGSSGGTLVERYGVYFAAGKDGIGYAVNSVKPRTYPTSRLCESESELRQAQKPASVGGRITRERRCMPR